MLRDSGHVVTMESVEKLIKKDMLNPITSARLRDKDIIPLQRVSHQCNINRVSHSHAVSLYLRELLGSLDLEST